MQKVSCGSQMPPVIFHWCCVCLTNNIVKRIRDKVEISQYSSVHNKWRAKQGALKVSDIKEPDKCIYLFALCWAMPLPVCIKLQNVMAGRTVVDGPVIEKHIANKAWLSSHFCVLHQDKTILQICKWKFYTFHLNSICFSLKYSI